MKSGWRIFWIVTACIAGLGVLFCVLALVLGTRVGDVRMASPFPSRLISGVVDFFDGDGGDGSADLGNHEHTGEFDYQFEGVQNLSLSAGNCEIEIQKYDGSTVNVDASHLALPDYMEFSATESGGNLHISLEREDGHGEIQKKSLGLLYIEIPEDLRFQNAEFTLGTADFYLEQIKADRLYLQTGASDSEIDWFEADTVDAAVGVGDLEMSGTLSGDMKLECGVGDAEVILRGKESDYNYKVDCGIGNVEIGDSLDFSGLAASRHIDNGSGKNIDISCGVGDVSLEFK